MTAQPDLFPVPRHSRRSDPRSSHEAGERMRQSGALGDQQAQAAAAVRAWPGRTSHELAELAHMDRYMLARRLPECERMEPRKVARGEIRACSVTGRSAMTWWPAGDAP